MTSALRQSGKERKMGKALIIGAGGVAGVVVHKCCQNSDVFTEICIASRTKSKCDALKKQVEEKGTKTKVTTAQVDADNVPELVALINKEKPDIVINVALPYQDLTIMDACLERQTMSIRQTTSTPIQPSLNTSISGRIGKSLKRRASQRFSEADLTPV